MSKIGVSRVRLWPITVFDGFESQEELKYYYPTNVLVTGWDIMFFWVARMIMAGYEWSGDLLGEELAAKKGIQPFQDVYFTGMVRDNKRRKMSKSLGNSPDALALIDRYGADGVRFGMLSSAAAGNDIVFDAPFDQKSKSVLNESALCEQGSKFCNKIWQGLNLINSWKVVEEPINADIALTNQLTIEWFENALNQTLSELEEKFKTYRLSDALMSLYNFMWNDFFSFYIEVIKPPYGEPIDRTSLEKTIGFYERLMTILHPFMPFITEEIWHQLKDRKEGDDCVISTYPKTASFDKDLIDRFEKIRDLISKVNNVRAQNNISKNEELALFVEESDRSKALFAKEGLEAIVRKMAKLSAFTFTNEEVPSSVSFLSGTENYFVEVNITVDVEAELKKLKEDLAYQEGFKATVGKKLNNERFVNNAPAAVVDKERAKMADAEEKIKILKEQINKLEG